MINANYTFSLKSANSSVISDKISSELLIFPAKFSMIFNNDIFASSLFIYYKFYNIGTIAPVYSFGYTYIIL